jgi:hypothetical protein
LHKKNGGVKQVYSLNATIDNQFSTFAADKKGVVNGKGDNFREGKFNSLFEHPETGPRS